MKTAYVILCILLLLPCTLAYDADKARLQGIPEQELADFNDAESLFDNEAYGLALSAYDFFMQEYPNSKLADDALFKKAMLHTKLEQFDLAIQEYEAIELYYPESGRIENAQQNIKLIEASRNLTAFNVTAIDVPIPQIERPLEQETEGVYPIIVFICILVLIFIIWLIIEKEQERLRRHKKKRR